MHLRTLTLELLVGLGFSQTRVTEDQIMIGSFFDALTPVSEPLNRASMSALAIIRRRVAAVRLSLPDLTRQPSFRRGGRVKKK